MDATIFHYRANSHDWEDTIGDPGDILLTELIGKRLRVVLFNDHGVATDYRTGRIEQFDPERDDVTWVSEPDGAIEVFPPDSFYLIEQISEPDPIGVYPMFMLGGAK